ncbi:MAG: dihydrolipoyl dehydrogenase family protein [Actinomycetales bacterium]
MSDSDLVVIGGGTAGLSAARTAARRGARAVLVSAGPLGGDCTHTGCVPSKTMLERSREGADFATTMAAVRASIATLSATEDATVLGREGVTVVAGEARLRGAGVVEVGGDVLRAPRIVIATGGAPVLPPIPGLADSRYVTNETVFDLPELPRRLAVLGGGAIGCELSQAFARLGSDVTLVEQEPRLLSREEPEASDTVQRALADAGVRVCVSTTLKAVEGDSRRSPVLVLADARGASERVEADVILVAVGRRPVTDGLGLEDCGVRVERGGIVVDDRMRTSVDGVYAAGDVAAGMLQLTHAANEMGRIAATNALSRVPLHRLHSGSIPWAVFTTPEVGRVGLTEAEAASRVAGSRVAYLPMTEVDRAITAGRTEGFVKLIAGPRTALGNTGGGRLLGATIVCERGGDLVHEPALLMRTGGFVGRLAQTVHAYPSWAMAVQKTAVQFFTEYEGRQARPARVSG